MVLDPTMTGRGGRVVCDPPTGEGTLDVKDGRERGDRVVWEPPTYTGGRGGRDEPRASRFPLQSISV